MEKLIIQLFEKFIKDINKRKFFGREREMISLFVMTQLINACKDGTVLYNPAQIVIEGAVPQIGTEGKKQVCKDLVIWDEPYKTCWDESFNPVNIPLVIMEWKVQGFWTRDQKNKEDLVKDDKEWLMGYSKKNNGVLCCSAYVNFEAPGVFKETEIKFVKNGKVLNI